MTEKKAIVNTFHSTTSRHLKRKEPDEIIAFDGRFELNIVEGGYYRAIENLPRVMAQAFLSYNIHLLMGNVAETNFFTTNNCLSSKLEFLAENFGLPFEERELPEVEDSINEFMDTKFNFISPEEIESVDSSSKETIVDIGLSYMKGYQKEALKTSNCKAPGSEEDVLELVENIEPKLLLISNVGDPDEISSFLEKLEDKDYEIEKGQIFEKSKAKKSLDLYEEFIQFHIGEQISGMDKYDPKSRTEDLRSWMIRKAPSKHL